MAEVHKRALDGDIVSDLDVEELVDRHLTAVRVPCAPRGPAAGRDPRVRRYVAENRTRLENTLYSEQQI